MRSAFNLCDRILHRICLPSAWSLTSSHNTHAVALCVMRCPIHRRIDKVSPHNPLVSHSLKTKQKMGGGVKRIQKNKTKKRGKNTNGLRTKSSSNCVQPKDSICHTHCPNHQTLLVCTRFSLVLSLISTVGSEIFRLNPVQKCV